MSGVLLPVEARYTLTADTIAQGGHLVRDSIMPRWLQIALPVTAALQALVQLPKILAGSKSPWVALLVIALLCAVFFGLSLFNKKRGRKNTKFLEGQEVVIRFLDDSLEFSVAGRTDIIGYRRITRAGKDSRGFAVFISNIGGFGIPTSAFTSAEHRDFVFEHLRAKLKE